MTTDPIAARVRDAVTGIAAPDFPAVALAARVAAAPPPVREGGRPVRALIVGGLVCAAALAAVTHALRPLPEPEARAIERLTGHRPAGSYEASMLSLDEVRRHTTFPIIVPRGLRVLKAQAIGDSGVTLVVTVDGRSQVLLTEQRAGRKPSPLDGVGIHADGTIRRFPVRRWTIGRVELSVPEFDGSYHAFAVRIERATRETAATERAGRSP